MNKQEKTQINFFQSMSFKIIMLVVAVGVICTIICDIFYMNYMCDVARDQAQDNLLDVSEAYGRELNRAFNENPDLTYDEYAEILQYAQVRAAEGSYAYLLDEEGVMIYHPSEDRMGTHVENELLCGVMDEIAAGRKPENGIGVSIYRGKPKYNSYYILDNNYLLNITADEEKVLHFQKDAYAKIGLISIFNLTFFVILGYIFSRFFSKPLRELTALVERTSQRDFSRNVNAQKIKLRKDEIGAIARAISVLRGNLRSIVHSIEDAENEIAGNMDNVVDASRSIDEMCTDTSATTQRLAAGMQQVASVTEDIHSNINDMQEEAELIQTQTKQGESRAVEIMQRAEHLKQVAASSSESATTICREMKEKTMEAIEDAKAVEKINALTAAIMEIASQTSLLALNASIEAARAGEAGKGFAVVATEIGSLANQSSDTVTHINNIVSEINGAVKGMVSTLTQTLDFLEHTVIEDYKQMNEISVQYEEDAVVFRQNMENIEQSISSLGAAVDNVADALGGINSTVSQTALGVTDIAEKTSDVVARTGENNHAIETCMKSLGTFEDIVGSFVLGD